MGTSADMDWTKSYKPERRAEWEDIAAAIRESVTMDEVIRLYSPGTPVRNRRCPCPFHNGKDFNFSFTDRGYKCFVCGASGDVIGFVKDICECATRSDAMKRINQDLRVGLPIDCTLSASQSATLALRRQEAEKREAELKAWQDEYARLMDEWVRLDKVKRTEDPSSESYAYAVKNIDRVSYELDTLLDKEPR